ncbi:CASH domain-dontaining protein [Methanophagales archaeon]|nr:CASH domain-dontaining protein [Methanophagales archaeon]
MGDMILVYSGVYYENVVVDKSVTLRGIGHPVVDAKWSGNAVTLTADGITLEGFDITNAEGSRIGAGIKITSNNNNITGNNVCNNNDHGINLGTFSEDNLIYLNNFIDNMDNVYDNSLWTTIWNSKEEITYTYNGNMYISYLGNYWADYDEKYPYAEEIDTTGIWDTPYSIYKEYNKDFYPLMEPRERYLP